MEAISHAGAAVGILTNSGVVLAAEKKILSKVRLFIFYIYTFRVSD
jgi:20S proteasome alpha/beta subunit|tara:strand:- start:255 stop:392 length:138 start_codon:yes stop_codon:yes gene_type:complete